MVFNIQVGIARPLHHADNSLRDSQQAILVGNALEKVHPRLVVYIGRAVDDLDVDGSLAYQVRAHPLEQFVPDGGVRHLVDDELLHIPEIIAHIDPFEVIHLGHTVRAEFGADVRARRDFDVLEAV